MKANREKFKQFVTEQLKDYDEWREASPDGYAEIITDEAVKLFCQPDVVGRSEQLVCDSCGCHPNVIYTTSKGRFCERCKPAN